MNLYIIKSSMFIWLKEEFSKMKGIKLYSIFKIVEYILSLINKFCSDIDIQIIRIISAKKNKHKFFSFLILIIFFFSNIYIFNIFYFCTWLIINDIEKNFILIYLKVNFIEFKQANKAFKFIHNFIVNDIFDRFLNFFILINIIINGLYENKIKIDFNNIYFKRICFYFVSEFISDYLKGIIIFKINNMNPKCIKLFLKEEIDFYREVDGFNKDTIENKYTYLKDAKVYKKYISFISKESIINILLNINLYPFIILLLCQIFNGCNLFLLLKILVLIFIKNVIENLIPIFNTKFYKNAKEENKIINSNINYNEDKIKEE